MVVFLKEGTEEVTLVVGDTTWELVQNLKAGDSGQNLKSGD